jgi:hypothetical protein
LLNAVGRRAVQECLITAVTSGSWSQRPARSAPGTGPSRVLVHRSAEAARARRHTPESQAGVDKVAGLRVRYRRACLAAFVDCNRNPTREWLAPGFIVDKSLYPPDLHALVARARAIAGRPGPVQAPPRQGK